MRNYIKSIPEADKVKIPCVPSVEICNGIDDNCNEWVDKFLDCDKAKKNKSAIIRIYIDWNILSYLKLPSNEYIF